MLDKTSSGAGQRTKLSTVLAWISLLFYPPFCLTVIEYFNYKALLHEGRVFQRLLMQITTYGIHELFALIVLFVLFLILLLLVRRAWIATGLFGALTLLCSYINYMKIKLNSVPFLPADIALIGESRELASYISVPIPPLFWAGLIIIAAWTVLLFLCKLRIPGKWFITPPVALALIIAILAVFSDTDRSTRILHSFEMDIFDNILQTSNYNANGFVSGFTLNLISMRVMPPEDYSQESVEAVLSPYSGDGSSENAENFDVILVLSESFFDLRKLSYVTYSENPLPNYDAIRSSENCYSGNIYTIAHGGGTVNTEFRMLTGLSTDRLLPSGATPYNYVHSPLEGYVSNYKRHGYKTIGVHLYNPNFYSRRQAYPYLGFDAFYTTADIENTVEIQYTRGYATDDSTERVIEYYMDQASSSEDPVFLFAITIENHQPYEENADNTITVSTDRLHGITAQALTTYAQGVKDADQMLGALRDYIDNRERPTVLVWFGDHLPTLGISYDPYHALGYYSADHSLLETRMTMFSTPFLVYANRELRQGLFSSKSDNQISDIYLMECVAESTGFPQTRYMQYLADAIRTLPIYNVELDMDDTLTREQSEIVNAWRLIAYDRMLAKQYSATDP